MPVRVRSQILFAESGSGLVRIDGSLMEPAGETLPAGSPMTMLLRLPESGIVASVVESTVGKWAEDIHIVDVELEAHPTHASVVLSDGVATVRLEAAGPLASN